MWTIDHFLRLIAPLLQEEIALLYLELTRQLLNQVLQEGASAKILLNHKHRFEEENAVRYASGYVALKVMRKKILKKLLNLLIVYHKWLIVVKSFYSIYEC